MKHIKKFDKFSINEENKFSKFFTGHGSKDEKNAKKAQYEADAEKYTQMANSDDNVIFNREFTDKKAKENNYKGHLEDRESRRDGKVHVIYVNGRSGLEEVASLAADKRNNPLN